ncbi:adenylate/guanylate cyclase [Nitzschia inconspicua]|uniref:Adenylate/guanylate cyclase n=1 Tax=Nitzschia inconspicua TaxID=303405 RepID=A0A9K3K6Q2_9STRA|nr:adenylate/guanylate cyclase [Nitzschia inconspicua]
MELENQGEGSNSAILDAIIKMDQELGDEQASVDSDSDRDVNSSSNDTGVSPSTDLSTSRGAEVGQEDGDSGVMSIAHTENKAVLVWKLVMIFVLLASTVAGAITVFLYVSHEEQASFEAAFSDNSLKLFEAIGGSLDIKLAAVDSFVTAIVSDAKARNQTWPFVTVPDFAKRASKIRGLSYALSVTQFQILRNDRDRRIWEDSYVRENDGWVQEGIDVQRSDPSFQQDDSVFDYVPHAHSSIWYGSVDNVVPSNSAPYTPTWQSYPVFPSPYNSNMIMSPMRGSAIKASMASHEVTISRVLNKIESDDPNSPDFVRAVNEWNEVHVGMNSEATEPLVQFLYPIIVGNDDSYQVPMNQMHPDNSTVVAFMATSFFWRSLLERILPEGQRGLAVVFHNECGQTFTYRIDGASAIFKGEGDLHNPKFNEMGETLQVSQLVDAADEATTYSGLPLSKDHCPYSLSIYPSTTFESQFKSNNPIIFTMSAVAIFVFTALVFLAYDRLVAVRQAKVMKSAVQSNAIVSSLFPSKYRERLYNDALQSSKAVGNGGSYVPSKARLKNFLREGNEDGGSAGQPIADLFTDCTVMFADIANFTAWSSAREPGQVFTLLETVYGAFDKIAARRGVFKIETIGDCYVAVTGLPEPRKDHAVVMVKFAIDCRDEFVEVTRLLEVSLGPDTADLGLRIGLHSGAVTAGVLRGQKSRFQLFGDTVNTAARMESTGMVNRIQISHTTATLLEEAKKGQWVKPREDQIQAKGKGLLQTYFVEPKSHNNGSKGSTENDKDVTIEDDMNGALPTKIARLVSWNADVLSRELVKVIQARHGRGLALDSRKVEWAEPSDAMVIQEVKEVIMLPPFDASVQVSDDSSLKLEEEVRTQLHDYVYSVAKLYNKNPFHNFEHASHVTMSVAKLLSRIVAPDYFFEEESKSSHGMAASTLHDHTYGITSDPLTQFACIFSALIHDCDHPGVPNNQLVKEGNEIAKLYQGKSVAEQNSVNLAWDLLRDPRYAALRNAICGSQEEEQRFRQLVVNAVMATDIMDKDLKKLRDDRWDAAFHKENRLNDILQVNRKATIVIEHLIQASDVAHTMQHWHVYIKWNERLFKELLCAYQAGRSDVNPANFWYDGELGFFDFYIIPLAKKLSECGVFGVSSDEYLTYAMENRREWEKKGKRIVAAYMAGYGSLPSEMITKDTQ